MLIKKWLLIKVFSCFIITAFCLGQGKTDYKIITVAFYNLENIFDIVDDDYKFDEASPIMELRYNQEAVYNKKIKNMASVIADIGREKSQSCPVIMGVAEVENRKVLEDLISDSSLIKSDYGIIHYDSPDARGIDVGFLYQKKIFRPLGSKAFELKLKDVSSSNRIFTRDVLLVSGYMESEVFYFLVNHWPSRRGGEVISSYKRKAAASLNRKLIDSLQARDPYAKIIIMGDFNDNPTDDSIIQVMGAKDNIKKLSLSDVYNPMIRLSKKGYGSNAYLDRWSLFDQIMLTSSLIDSEFKGYRYYKAGIFNKDYLIDRQGRFKGYPLRSFSDGRFTGGYSDHFPVYLYLIKKVSAK